MKETVQRIAENAQEIEQYSQSDIKVPSFIPKGFIDQLTKPFTQVRNWAKAVTDFCVESSDNQDEASRAISKLETEVQDLEQRLAQLEQTCVDKLRDFVEANQ
ncbi:hypothetical protein INR79_24290 [Vibrio sp. SCSIO 43132]|uniref:hypothetical protein n=1 Tax=Vibrio sp. SCSIO 43132 TaxID=2779363 RepID=UPI001CA9AE5C|nr:hypothetical protein [Vibrio sp. SCSIO 43132]UAB72380.1 hypothetical protein INR79_24290 [Vibrio sp. SCSIO 43132]